MKTSAVRLDDLGEWKLPGLELQAKALPALDAVSSVTEMTDCLPVPEAIFRAFAYVPPRSVRVVILGQDPYPNPEDAMGLAFSSPAPKLPASLRNIFKELSIDLGIKVPSSGDLSHWARQGVLLANTALTVSRDKTSHFKCWAAFTQTWIAALAQDHPIVWILWGKHAQSWKPLIVERSKSCNIDHVILEGVHPSPLSAHRGFMGSRPFSQVNEALRKLGHTPIDW